MMRRRASDVKIYERLVAVKNKEVQDEKESFNSIRFYVAVRSRVLFTHHIV